MLDKVCRDFGTLFDVDYAIIKSEKSVSDSLIVFYQKM